MRTKKEVPKEKKNKKIGYLVAIIVSVFLIYVINNLLNWHIPFLTNNFIVCLPLFTISLSANIMANAVFIIYEEKWFKKIAEIILNVISIILLYTFYKIFPLSFNLVIYERLARGFILFITVVLFIAIAVEVIEFIVEASKIKKIEKVEA